MKAQHIIATALLASAMLVSCNPLKEENHSLTVPTCTDFTSAVRGVYKATWTMIRIYRSQSHIQVDTSWFYEDGECIGYRKIYTFPDNDLVCESSIIDTIHTVYVPSGDYILASLYFPQKDTSGQLIYSPHFSRIGIRSDTIIFDTLRNKPGSDDYDKLY